jgi:hypothetical protein
MTQEFLPVAINDAAGAPRPAPLPVAPIAPDPFVPELLTPVKVTTVIDEAAEMAKLAETETFESADGANARQISLVPRSVLILTTKTQVNPAPVTPVTVLLAPEDVGTSVEISANNNSFHYPTALRTLAWSQ